MNASTPSLFRLFRRSRYRTPLFEGDEKLPDPNTDVRSDRERFATAAVAFCIQHSPKFKNHFWKTICRLESDPATVPQMRAELEPPHWADLRLIPKTQSPHQIWVIEFKLDCDLADKQHPEEDAFKQPDVGYGDLLSKSFESQPPADLRYVVLGSRRLSNGSGQIDQLGIRWQARTWHDLEANAPYDDSLTSDLIESLEQLGISAFRMKETKQMHVLTQFGQAADAWQVLTDLAAVEFCQCQGKVKAEPPSAKHFNIGMFLRDPKTPKTQPNGSGAISKLAKQLQSPEGPVVWLGYETGPDVGGFRRSVWFYCKSKQIAKNLSDRLVGDQYHMIVPARDGTAHCVAVHSDANQPKPDYDWFIQAINAGERASRQIVSTEGGS